MTDRRMRRRTRGTNSTRGLVRDAPFNLRRVEIGRANQCSLVCDWSHGVAQLYWRVKGSVVSPQIPPLPNCAEVKLQVSYELDLKMSLKDKGID